MSELGKGRVWVVVAATVGAYVGLRLGFSRESAIKILNGLFIGTALVTMLVFSRLFWRGLTQPRLDRVTALVFSFVLSFLGSLLMRGWSVWVRSTYVQPTLHQTELLPIGIYLLVLSGLFAIAATGMDGQGELRHHKALLWSAIVLGLLVALALSYLQGV